jgi:hypothetical protein
MKILKALVGVRALKRSPQRGTTIKLQGRSEVKRDEKTE